jgi:hypothetical protein
MPLDFLVSVLVTLVVMGRPVGLAPVVAGTILAGAALIGDWALPAG